MNETMELERRLTDDRPSADRGGGSPADRLSGRQKAAVLLISLGTELAAHILKHLVGPARAEEIISQLTAKAESRPFEFLRRTPPEQVAAFLKDESPQTVALVVASVHTSLAARVLSELPPELQAEVALRIATMKETNPEVIRDIEQGLRHKLANVVAQE